MKHLNGSLILIDESQDCYAVRFDDTLSPGKVVAAIEAFAELVLGGREALAVYASPHSDAGKARTDAFTWENLGVYTPEDGFNGSRGASA